MTAHASQGATLDAAIVDLQIPITASWTSMYVALSRARRADDLLIFREFDKEQLPSVQVVSTKEIIAELAASKGGANPKKKQRGEDTLSLIHI
mgnify:CR=1 FL=1